MITLLVLATIQTSVSPPAPIHVDAIGRPPITEVSEPIKPLELAVPAPIPELPVPPPQPKRPVVAFELSSGNTYIAGNCTWYAKSKRPDLPNNLGNANTWAYRAAAQGFPTGSTPAVGAIGQQGMHVVYIERVNGDGTVFLSEMNYVGLGIVSTRTANASDFRYIY